MSIAAEMPEVVEDLALDDRPLAKRIGLVLLATDHTTEPDFRRLVASNSIGVYSNRIAYENPVTPENLGRMSRGIESGAELILPGESLDAVCYSCTSASVVIGDDAVEAAIRRAKPGVPVVTPPLAAARALQALGARRISLLTPYTMGTTRPMADYFADRGFELASVACLGFDDDRVMARIAPASLAEAAVRAMAPDAEALFISCTAVRAALIAAHVEARIGRPVVTSNLATAWACLRLCGASASHPDFASLSALEYPAC